MGKNCWFIVSLRQFNESLTALTAGGIKDVDIATPTKEAMLSLRIPNATAAPDSKAMIAPTHNERGSPLKLHKKMYQHKNIFGGSIF